MSKFLDAGVLRRLLPEADAVHPLLLPWLRAGRLLLQTLSLHRVLPQKLLPRLLLPQTLPRPLPASCGGLLHLCDREHRVCQLEHFYRAYRIFHRAIPSHRKRQVTELGQLFAVAPVWSQ
jgi:hypothetical protein